MDRLTENFGFGIIPKQVMKDSTLSLASKGLYSYLCAYAGNKDTAFPSISLITYELKISKDTFYKYMNELKEKKYIATYQCKVKGQFSHSVYNLLPCPKSSDTETSYTEVSCTENMDTNINSIKKNSIKKKNKEEIKPSIKKTKLDIEQTINNYTVNAELKTTIIDFLDMRRKQKDGITDIAITKMLTKLSKIGKTDAEKIDILDNSTMCSYKGIFPLKTGQQANASTPKKYQEFGSAY